RTHPLFDLKSVSLKYTIQKKIQFKFICTALFTIQIIAKQLYSKLITSALRAGYRAFDTGAVYGYEAYLGQVLKELLPKYGLSCEDVFIISKLAPLDHGTRAKEACLRSLEGFSSFREFYASGQFRAIGVSNYNAKHIRELLMSCRVPPLKPEDMTVSLLIPRQNVKFSK
uniref:Zgc:110782 n=1 Tax=Sinocyclocheilus rhinocerous TaxID=307959 RepID=A0A673IA81_9TELE